MRPTWIWIAVAAGTCTFMHGSGVAAENLLFRSGFEADTHLEEAERKAGPNDRDPALEAIINYDGGYSSAGRLRADDIVQVFVGKDHSTGYDWEREKLIDRLPGLVDIIIDDWHGRPNEDAYLKLIDDPEGERGRILQFTVVSDDGKGPLARPVMDLELDPKEFKQLGVCYDFKIDESFKAVPFEELDNPWWLFSEIWANPEKADDMRALPVYLKHRGDACAFSSIVFRVSPVTGNFQTRWKIPAASEAPIMPFGEWVRIGSYFRPGPAGEGRYLLQVNGQTVFDVRDRDLSGSRGGWFSWSPLKFYIALSLSTWMRENGTPATVYYDNLELVEGFPDE